MLDDFKSSDNISLSIWEGLSIFFSDDCSDFINVLANPVLISKHVSLSDKERHLKEPSSKKKVNEFY